MHSQERSGWLERARVERLRGETQGGPMTGFKPNLLRESITSGEVSWESERFIVATKCLINMEQRDLSIYSALNNDEGADCQ